VSDSTYYVYVIRCADGSLYSGITTDVVRRMGEHRSKSPAAAKYTRTHGAVGLEGLWRCEGRSAASKLEWRLHHMTRAQKLALLGSPGEAGEGYEPVDGGEREGMWERSSEHAHRE
jgi:putative endonuclease